MQTLIMWPGGTYHLPLGAQEKKTDSTGSGELRQEGGYHSWKERYVGMG